MRWLAFDLEIAATIPEGADWEAYRPFGISVAATLPCDGEVRLWYGVGAPDGKPWQSMPQSQVQVLVAYLERMTGDGYTIVTWNGLSFDFRVLAEESGLWAECRALALRSIDPMFQFFCEHGFAVGLEAVAHGFGIPGKTAGMGGAQAPVLWEAGEYDKVLEYVSQDVRVTGAVFDKILSLGGSDKGRHYIWWQDRRGADHVQSLDGLLTVAEAMVLPEPVPPHWIKNPWERSRFTGWLSDG